jgi:hypothetical protein
MSMKKLFCLFLFSAALPAFGQDSNNSLPLTVIAPVEKKETTVLVEPFLYEGLGDLVPGLWETWTLRVHRSAGVLVGSMGERWGFYLGAGEYTFRGDYDEDAKKLLKLGHRLKGSVEAKYFQAIVGARFNLTQWGRTGFYVRAQLKPSWKTSQWSNATEEYNGFFSSSEPPKTASRPPATPDFILMWRNGAGFTTFVTDNLQLNLEIAGESPLVSTVGWEDSNPYGVVGGIQGSVSVSF